MTYGVVNVDGMTTSWGDTSAGLYGFKNRIINGAMMIDQRNNGASGTAVAYTVDRFFYNASQASKGTWQQNAGSVTPPTGFKNYLGFTSSSAYTLGATDYFGLYQSIEGLNIIDLAWGTANAQSVTLSFRVYSSITGTFAGSLNNSGYSRSYPFTYTISSANTWTTINVTIPGDTAGTWLTTNGIGITVNFSLGTGATYSGTANAWAGSLYLSATGATSVVGTNGATFYITGVQLEKGTTATSFDYRSYGTELSLCQRYYESGVWAFYCSSSGFGTTYTYNFVVTKRTSPTVITNNGSPSSSFTNGFGMYLSGTAGSTTSTYTFTSSAEL
jgi:hypothetical protein